MTQKASFGTAGKANDAPLPIEERVKAIAGEEGFWRPDNEKTFLDAAAKLHGLLSDDEIVDLLESLYVAVCDEYGG